MRVIYEDWEVGSSEYFHVGRALEKLPGLPKDQRSKHAVRIGCCSGFRLFPGLSMEGVM